MPEPQTLREILDVVLKNLEEREKKAKDLEIEAQKIREEVEETRQKLVSSLGLESKEEKIVEGVEKIVTGVEGEETKNDSVEKDALHDMVLSTISELGKKGPFSFSDVIRHLELVLKINKDVRRRVHRTMNYQVRLKNLLSRKCGQHHVYEITPKKTVSKPSTLSNHILQAIHELEDVGSETTANAIHHQLVHAHGRTYDDLSRHKVECAIYYLANDRRLTYISKKIGRKNCYKLTGEGKETLKILSSSPNGRK